MELPKIYTRKGDDGTTGLFNGPRISKASLRVQTYGTIDELNTAIGVAKIFSNVPDIKKLLERIQHKLMNSASILASPLNNTDPARIATPARNAVTTAGWHSAAGGPARLPIITELEVTGLEKCIDYFNTDLLPITTFIVPGQNKAGAFLSVARTTCRRTERMIVSLAETEEVDPVIRKFSNRLSDLLFTLERYEYFAGNIEEKYWEK